MCLISKADMTAIVDALGEIVHEQLAHDEEVALPGIGKLSVTQRAARIGRNPQTGEAITLPATKTPKFRATKSLKEVVSHG
nr:HU family DNA-binding protein [Marinobacter shengliensis]